MIEYINVQLSIWGKWALARNCRGLGFPSVSPMFQQCKHGGGYGSRPPTGVSDYVDETDKAVQLLDACDQALCVEFYQHGGKSEDIARRLGIAKRTLYDRLEAVQRKVMGHMNDLAAGC